MEANIIETYVDSRNKYCQLISKLHETMEPSAETKALADWLVRQHIDFYQGIANKIQGLVE